MPLSKFELMSTKKITHMKNINSNLQQKSHVSNFVRIHPWSTACQHQHNLYCERAEQEKKHFYDHVSYMTSISSTIYYFDIVWVFSVANGNGGKCKRYHHICTATCIKNCTQHGARLWNKTERRERDWMLRARRCFVYNSAND